MDRWNPFTAQIPFTMLSSHVLARRRAVHEPRLSVETLVPELERAVQEAKRAQVRPYSGSFCGPFTPRWKVL